MTMHVNDVSGIVEEIRQAPDSAALWRAVQPFLTDYSNPTAITAVLEGISNHIRAIIASENPQALITLITTMPETSAEFAAEVQARLLQALFESGGDNATTWYATLRGILPEPDQQRTMEMVPLCDAIQEYQTNGPTPQMVKVLGKVSKANAAFTRVVLDEQRRGRRPSEDAFERSHVMKAFLQRLETRYPGLFNAVQAAARVEYDVQEFLQTQQPTKAPNGSTPRPAPVVREQSSPSTPTESARTPKPPTHPDLTFEDMADADMTLEDELFEAIKEARQLPVGQRRTVLLDLADRYPNSVWPFAELSGIMPRAKENLEMAERGLQNASRFEDRAFIEAHRGHFWELRETQPYMRLLLHKARGLMDVRRLDAALDVLEKALEL